MNDAKHHNFRGGKAVVCDVIVLDDGSGAGQDMIAR